MPLERRDLPMPLGAPHTERKLRSKRLAAALLAMLPGAACGASPAPPPPTADTAPPRPPTTATTSARSAGGAAVEATPKVDITLEQLLDAHRSYEPRAIDSNRFLFLSDAPGTAQRFTA